MKQIINTLAVCVMMLIGAGTAQAQQKFDDSWKERVMSEKIAFLTVELNITPEEAQTFWPVYNKVEKELDQARFEVMKSYKALAEAVEANKPSKEISVLLDKYLQAKTAQDKLDSATANTYKTVLPVEKVAKLYVAEEKFRRQYITKLHKRTEERK
jgi:hypothetical protein